MKKIDTNTWSIFEIGELFTAKNTGNILVHDVDDGSGDIPYVTASGINNGVSAYIDASKYEKIKGNCILVGGKTFTLTYQQNDFVSNDSHNFILRLHENQYGDNIYLFLLVVIKASLKYKYSWGDAVTKDKILKEKIILPATPSESPDFAYMDSYILQKEKKVRQYMKMFQRVLAVCPNTLDISHWRNFEIGKLFRIVKGKRLTKADMKDGNIKFIGASAEKNGETARIGNNQYLHKAGTITVNYNGSIGSAFYQEEPFWASDDVNVLYPKFEMTKYIAMFFLPILKAKGLNYAFIDKWTKENMEKDTILLPVAEDGTPDFSYMDSYMRAKEATVLARLNLFNALPDQ